MPDREGRPGAVEGITVYRDSTVIEGREGMEFFRLAALRGALKLQKAGIRYSRRGPSALSIARKMGYQGKIDGAIDWVESKINAMKADAEKRRATEKQS